jgi:HK97 gp10 family phage protein
LTSFNITITGVDQVIKRLSDLQGGKMQGALNNAFSQASRLALSTLQNNTPVDTGALKASEDITVVSPQKVLVGPNVSMIPHYAPDVEFGHHTRSGSWVPGQHFVELTAVQIRMAVINIFIKSIRRIIHG